jgi:hypothetical protein
MVFRDVNERITALAEGWRSGQPQALVCECSDDTCTASIAVSGAEYDSVRAHPDRFVVAPDHVDDSTERVIWASAHFAVVEKLHVGLNALPA